MRIPLVFALTLGVRAWAQPVTPSPVAQIESQTVARLLASAEPAQLAWGAYLAANYRRPEFSPNLLRLATWTDGLVRMAAIDALIRLDVDVPENVLTQIAADDLDPALIFIARRPGKYGQLVNQLMARKLEDHQWVALHSILLASPPEGFAASVLKDWTIRITVDVNDAGESLGSGSIGGGYIVDGSFFARPGFPPLEAYYVNENPKPGDVLLAAGPHPVGYRTQKAAYRGGSTINRDDYRKDYLLHMARIPPSDRAINLRSNVGIEWKNAAAYTTAAEQTLIQTRNSVRFIRQRLAERNVLAHEERDLNPKLEVTVHDWRTRHVSALPAISGTLDGSRE